MSSGKEPLVGEDISLDFHDDDGDDMYDDDDTYDHQDTDALLGQHEQGDMSAEPAQAEGTSSAESQGNTAATDAAVAASVWSFGYYQSFFDVNTADVTKRVKLGAIPTPKFLEETKSKSDLYGPFWISTTLIFALALTGNLAHYTATPQDQRTEWHYDFSKVTLAATAIYGYTTLVPIGLWLGMRFYSALAVSAFDLLCLYGYSLTVYILAACLCGLPFVDNGFQWGIIMTVMGTSSAVVVINLSRLLHDAPARLRIVVIAVAVLANAALAVGFKMYFFQY
ncbi:hypothetical protein PTSG_06621 [Salpingoeca rosetta]|uniref:Protein YIPF n=1 Tax=Salpingoeca rosetta (strain ATCC 50818 / BSB-021) TaxID=946362 RepID=F2UFI3_SALR5|nr:uncharacterized protein PTSG_06621 [Salpingoeca rosetta]EGD75551.1 hypothetical protein PTSG_06621 [Salpingoeca rosetta]|eukprot:XP_004992008.1 hypothetical protein PTSG_06621 [Salpingoeca rosetta]